MVNLAHLLDEFHLRIIEVEVCLLTVEELTRDTADGNDGNIRGLCLCSQFLSRELFLCGQCSWHEADERSILGVFLGHLLESLLLGLLGIGDILLVSSLQLIGNNVAAILQTVEKRHHISVVHITGTRTACDEVIGCAAIECHVLHVLLEGQSLFILHQHHTLGSTLTGNGSVSLQVGLVGVFITLETRTPLHEVQHALNVTVEVGHVEFAALHT